MHVYVRTLPSLPAPWGSPYHVARAGYQVDEEEAVTFELLEFAALILKQVRNSRKAMVENMVENKGIRRRRILKL